MMGPMEAQHSTAEKESWKNKQFRQQMKQQVFDDVREFESSTICNMVDSYYVQRFAVVFENFHIPNIPFFKQCLVCVQSFS